MGFCVGSRCDVGNGYDEILSDFIPLTRANFHEHKKRILKVIEDIEIDDLDVDYEMSLKSGVLMGNHANQCDTCNILHYLMAFVINKHRLKVDA